MPVFVNAAQYETFSAMFMNSICTSVMNTDVFMSLAGSEMVHVHTSTVRGTRFDSVGIFLLNIAPLFAFTHTALYSS